jgi:hypothetical protein
VTAGVQVTGLITGTAVTQSATDTTADRLTKVGDFGPGSAAVPALPSSDFTAEMRTGFWRVTESAAVGHPTTEAYYLGALVSRVGGSESGLLGGHGVLTFRMSGATAANQRLRFGNRLTNTGSLNWVEIFHTGRILGTVSQSSGVPTGALIESGNNANGFYTRFANGLLICRHTLAAASGAAVTWTYPSAFSAAPDVTGNAVATVLSAVCLDTTPGTTSVTFSARDKTDARRADTCELIAIGRWF